MITGYNPEDEEDDEEADYGLQEFLEADYEMGLELKDKIIPHAVMFFTGEYEGGGIMADYDEEDLESGEEDEEYDEEKDTDYKPQEGQAAQPECKQQ